MTREEKFLTAALESVDYRTFMVKAFAAGIREGAKFNFAALSRKAGFSSRGFISEIIDGRRRLTAASYPKILKALALPKGLKTYFELLVAREEEELNPKGFERKEIDARLEQQRAQFRSRLAAQEETLKAADVLSRGRHMLDCFAALGSPETGATLEEVVSKTGLAADTCARVLAHFAQQTVAVERGGRYYSSNPHLIFSGLGDRHGAKSCYLETLGELKRKADADFKARDRAFIQSVFSVDRHKLPELKARLSEVIDEFVQESVNDDGDCVSKLLVGLYS